MYRLNPTEREAILARVSKLERAAETLEMTADAKSGIVATTESSQLAKNHGIAAAAVARSARRQIQKLLASLYA